MQIECSYRNYTPAPVFLQFIEKKFMLLNKYSLITDDTIVIVSINFHEKTNRYKLKAFIKNLKSTSSIFSELKSHDLHKAVLKLKLRLEEQIKVLKEIKSKRNLKKR